MNASRECLLSYWRVAELNSRRRSWIRRATANSTGDASSTLSHGRELKRGKRTTDGTDDSSAAEGVGLLGGRAEGDLGFLVTVRVIKGGLDVVDQMAGVTSRR